MSLVADPKRIRLAMVGVVEGNGHPYSWSAIINGRYNREAMTACGYPLIPQYLDAQPPSALGIPGIDVTHIWCDRPQDAANVARATFIPHVVDRPTDVIGHVDAVMIPTDIGGEHIERARPSLKPACPSLSTNPWLIGKTTYTSLLVGVPKDWP